MSNNDQNIIRNSVIHVKNIKCIVMLMFGPVLQYLLLTSCVHIIKTAAAI